MTTTDELIINLENKPFCRSAVSSLGRLTAAQQVIIETNWTDHLQNLIDFGNQNYLKNFSLRLEMEYPIVKRSGEEER